MHISVSLHHPYPFDADQTAIAAFAIRTSANALFTTTRIVRASDNTPYVVGAVVRSSANTPYNAI